MLGGFQSKLFGMRKVPMFDRKLSEKDFCTHKSDLVLNISKPLDYHQTVYFTVILL